MGLPSDARFLVEAMEPCAFWRVANERFAYMRSGWSDPTIMLVDNSRRCRGQLWWHFSSSS